MKKVTSYEDSNGSLHATPLDCMEREITMEVGRLVSCHITAKMVAEHSYAIQKILQNRHKNLEEMKKEEISTFNL